MAPKDLGVKTFLRQMLERQSEAATDCRPSLDEKRKGIADSVGVLLAG